MTNIATLKQRCIDISAESKALLDTAMSEARELTEEEKTKDDALYAEYHRLKADFERHERQQEMEKALIGDSIDDPAPNLVETPKAFDSFGEFAGAVKAATSSGFRQVDSRLNHIQAATGMSSNIPSDGGFLVQSDFASEIMGKVHETGALFNLCRKIPISNASNSIKIQTIDETSRADGSRWGGIRGYWTAEGVATTKSKPKVGRGELELKKLAALVYVTDEQLQDTPFLGEMLTTGVSEELGFKLDDAIVNGDGVGKPEGILNASATVSQAKEGSQTATTINYANIVKMWSRLWVRSRGTAVWLVNQDCEGQLDQLIHEGSAGAIAHRFVSVDSSGTRAMYGRPVLATEQCATLGTVGDIILCDPTQYLIAQKGGMESATSMHLKFEEHEQAFRFTMRVDGASAWSSALTPYKGSSTVSPFVSLATRS